MSEATDRPFDDDAWAKACAEDLAAEQERRRARAGGSAGATGTAAEELFKLFEAVADKVAELNNPVLGAAAQGAVRQFVNQAKAAAKPVVERHPEVFDHLAAAGSELLAAYRSAVAGHERRWTSGAAAGPTGAGRESGPDGGASGDARDPRDSGGDDDGGPGPSERIDLD
ncbi:DUF5304 domain-containing protein [Streptomyces antimicrobicus]|uniref:DUF5304 domain-containing protein n=1 Tax=Streptomyces antimicrobicus TaxID=2883108 RepID=A0ABS8BA23_9ACTN|nr:DUF5304 domain-containing protein [Streptomyces antimicrobicus]MCB5181403.1 DUF5304 domain-containing protein [Streptomyces antimicrobicus]